MLELRVPRLEHTHNGAHPLLEDIRVRSDIRQRDCRIWIRHLHPRHLHLTLRQSVGREPGVADMVVVERGVAEPLIGALSSARAVHENERRVIDRGIARGQPHECPSVAGQQ